MKKNKVKSPDELRPEYDLAKLRGRVLGKHYKSYRKGTNLALLAPEVREAFPTDQAVNRALRSVMKTKTGTSVATRATKQRPE